MDSKTKTIITIGLSFVFAIYLNYVGLSFGEVMVAALISGVAIAVAEL